MIQHSSRRFQSDVTPLVRAASTAHTRASLVGFLGMLAVVPGQSAVSPAAANGGAAAYINGILQPPP